MGQNGTDQHTFNPSERNKQQIKLPRSNLLAFGLHEPPAAYGCCNLKPPLKVLSHPFFPSVYLSPASAAATLYSLAAASLPRVDADPLDGGGINGAVSLSAHEVEEIRASFVTPDLPVRTEPLPAWVLLRIVTRGGEQAYFMLSPRRGYVMGRKRKGGAKLFFVSLCKRLPLPTPCEFKIPDEAFNSWAPMRQWSSMAVTGGDVDRTSSRCLGVVRGGQGKAPPRCIPHVRTCGVVSTMLHNLEGRPD